MFPLVFLLFFSDVPVQATPLVPRDNVTPLNSSQVDFYTPFTHFASAAYCDPDRTLTWTCGEDCDANPGFFPVASGGDGADIQYWYVGVSLPLGSVVVCHQGTDFSKIQPLVTDSDALLETLDPELFPNVDPSIQVHTGFANEQAKTANDVLDAVKYALSLYTTRKVAVVGHSLGAAISLLDGLYLKIHVKTHVFMIGYGMPRVGNQAFADYVDANLNVTHINNKKDFVPILPGIFLGYHHPSGEIHIDESDIWESCAGQDNPSKLCTVGDVPDILAGNRSDHSGPYNGVTMGC